MIFTKWTAAALTAILLASAPAFADDMDKKHDHKADRYNLEVTPGNNLIFERPVSFTGEVIESSNSHRTIKAANGTTIKVPVQALLWNGNTRMFHQSTNVGDTVVVHLRPEEAYRVMMAPSVEEPWVAVGGYDGVFYLTKEFINDIDVAHLDSDIYSDDKDTKYDEDLKSND